MRMTLQKYLRLDGNSIKELAQIMGLSHETIRRWNLDTNQSTEVVFDPATEVVDSMDIGTHRTIKPVPQQVKS